MFLKKVIPFTLLTSFSLIAVEVTPATDSQADDFPEQTVQTAEKQPTIHVRIQTTDSTQPNRTAAPEQPLEQPVEEITPSYWSIHPLHIGGNAIRLGSADISHSPEKGHLVFGKYSTFVDLLIPVTKKSYFFPRVDWTTFTMDWNKNPKFNEHQFNYAQFSLTFYSIELDQWRWIMRAQYNLDTKHFDNPRQYGLFTGLVWGANEFRENWHYHIGALGYTGMEGGEFWPVIGFDYTPTPKWSFAAIFPIEYYIQYKMTNHWLIALKARPLKERFRVGKDQPQPKSVFSYSTVGTELNIRYEIIRRFEIEAYGGWNFGGTFYIKNEAGKKALYTQIGSSPYFGAAFNWGF